MKAIIKSVTLYVKSAWKIVFSVIIKTHALYAMRDTLFCKISHVVKNAQ